MSAWRSEHHTVAGLRVRVRERGGGRPIVLLHGFPTSALTWREVGDRLASQRRVIAPDLVGMGGSDKPRDFPYTFDAQSRVFGALVDHLGLDRVELVGNDIGGPVVALWAVRHPERVTRLTLVGSFALPRVELGDRFRLGLMRLPGVRRLVTSRASLARELRSKVVRRGRMAEHLVATYLYPYRSRRDLDLLARVIAAPLSVPGHPELHEIEAGLPGVVDRLRLVWGAADRRCAGSMRALSRRFPGVPASELRGAGQLVQEDRPRLLARLLDAQT